MELDEALLKIVELEETVKNQNVTMDTLKNDLETKNNEIDRLQKSNMELFLKITDKSSNEEEVEDIEEEEIKISKMDKLLSDWGV